MYAWEHGFTKSEVKKWINSQLHRYRNDGYGYFAVILKETGRLIGQAGLLKSDIEGADVMELGYIFDDKYWGKGYAAEASRACINLAFDELGVGKLHCTIRPENEVSVRLAKRMALRRSGNMSRPARGRKCRISSSLWRSKQRVKYIFTCIITSIYSRDKYQFRRFAFAGRYFS